MTIEMNVNAISYKPTYQCNKDYLFLCNFLTEIATALLLFSTVAPHP
jgi:hypothetical protein